MSDLSIAKAVFLGALQGATEFLPVSSSGHLVIAQGLLGVQLENGGMMAFDVCLHFGTLIAIVAVFWRDIIQILASFFRRGGSDPGGAADAGRMTDVQARRLGLFLIVGTLPAVVLGLSLKDLFERLFSNVLSAAIMLLVTGAILMGTRFIRQREIPLAGMGWRQALAVGVAQAVAIIPGISRSGSTIAGGLYLGLDRRLAARFAFLLAVPAIGGAAFLQVKDLMLLTRGDLLATIIGSIVAAVVGVLSIKWLLGIVQRGRLSWFAYYCWAAGAATLVFLFLR